MIDKTIGQIFDTFTQEQREMTYCLVGYAAEFGRNYLAGTGDFDNDKQRELRNTREMLNEEQRLVFDHLVEEAIKKHKRLED